MSLKKRVASALMRRAVERAMLARPLPVAEAAEARALSSFRRAAREVSAYRALLEASSVDEKSIVTIQDFHRQVPVMSKQALFEPHPVRALTVNGRFGDGTLVFMSSGYSGAFSFGLETPEQARRLALRLDVLFDFYFRTATRRTLLLNALPGSVRVPSRQAVVAELGPRPDAALRALGALAADFEQIVLVAEPLLVKAVVEHACDARLELHRRTVHVVTGGELVTAGFRRHIGALLAHDETRPDRGQLTTSFGVSELGLSLAHDTAELRRIGHALDAAPELCARIVGDAPYAPSLLQYFPDQHYLETPLIDGRPSLVVTTLEPSRQLPLVRYATGDWALSLTHAELSRRLTAAGKAALVPRSRLPLLALWGRGAALELGPRRVYVEQVKAALYDDPDVCALTSGRFRLQRAGEAAMVCIELRQGVHVQGERLAGNLEARFADVLARRVGGDRMLVRFAAAGSAGFDSGFERKSRYL
jgi:phenylacetate-coenzyme A ligase PaaK-like adenylate-forming protein